MEKKFRNLRVTLGSKANQLTNTLSTLLAITRMHDDREIANKQEPRKLSKEESLEVKRLHVKTLTNYARNLEQELKEEEDMSRHR